MNTLFDIVASWFLAKALVLVGGVSSFVTRVVGKLLGIEALVSLPIGALVIQPRLADRCDHDPVAGQVDGVAIGLIDG